jgi:hypothetical protein
MSEVLVIVLFAVWLFVSIWWFATGTEEKLNACLEALSDGEWHLGVNVARSSPLLGRGTVYVHLARLEKEGQVESKEVPGAPGGLSRREYRLVAPPCCYCGQPASREYAIHRDAGCDGPEIPLCNTCAECDAITCEMIWDRIKEARRG